MILVVTSLSFLIPAISKLFQKQHKKAALYTLTSIVSANYWRNPEEKCVRLLADQCIARGSFMFHLITTPKTCINILCGLTVCSLYVVSNKSYKHNYKKYSLIHAGFHTASFVGMIIA